MADHKVLTGLLGKLGVEDSERFTVERATKKLKNRIEKGEIPADLKLTDGELTALGELGYKPGAAGEAVAGTPAASAPKGDDESVYTLKGYTKDGKKVDDRVEKLKASVASRRNRDRTDGRKWELTPDAKVTPAAAPAASDKADKETTSTVQKVEASDKDKAAKGGKKKEGKRGDTERGTDVFAALLPKSGSKAKKIELVAEIVKRSGVSESTAASYVVWAKRPIKDKIKNPFGFRVTEEKVKDEKVITRN